MLYPDIDPVVVALGPVQVHWYGLMYLIGFIGGWWLGRVRAARPNSGWSAEQIDDLVFYIAIGVVAGGRVGYVLFYGLDNWADDWLYPIRITDGGMSFHGGFLGVLTAMWLFGRKHAKGFWPLTDFIAPLIPLGLGSGRVGNFINGELWGAPGEVAWAMQVRCAEFTHLCSAKLGLPPGTELTPPLHPTQLYQAILEGPVLLAILWFYSARSDRPVMATSALFLIFYGLFRFAVEFVRMPDAHLGYLAFGWLTMGQLLSAPMIVIGIGLWVHAHRRHARLAGSA